MIINRGFKFKLKPTSANRNKFLCFAGAVRWVFNRGLDQKKKAFETTGKSPTYFEQNKELTLLKEQPETSWLGEVHSQILQQKLKDLDRSFRHFFRRVKKEKHPAFQNSKRRASATAFDFHKELKSQAHKFFYPKSAGLNFANHVKS